MSLSHVRRPAAVVAAVAILVGWFGAPADAARRTVFKSNTTAIAIPSGGAASPYPSTINIGRRFRDTKILDVNVTLSGYSHTFPDDVDVLLVGPRGQRVILMSDVGGLTDVSNINLTLDDEAAAPLPDGGPVVAGAFQPTDAGDGTDNFPAPAPPEPGLAVFDKTSPRGQWQLFVQDDLAGDTGQFAGGWTLQLRLKIPR